MSLAKTSELSEHVLKGDPVKLTFHYNSRDNIRFMNSIITKILSKSDMLYLQGVVENVMRELIINAVKANSKRVYFKKRNLNITDPSHYNEGMTEFKDYLVHQNSTLSADLREHGYRVELNLRKEEDAFTVVIRNNTPLLPFEEERIRMRLEKAREYNDFSDIYMDIADDIEGEGLGIPLTMLFLRNSGIGENSLYISSDGKITQSGFTIPLKIQPSDIMHEIRQKLIDEINDLPTFPENVVEIQTMCRNEKTSMKQIAGMLSRDPALSASVLKLSNSALFISSRKIQNITDALTVIGLKNLNSILLASSARKIMEDKFSSYKEVWNHCARTAFYGRCIARHAGLNTVSDMVSLAGLLHDLGKIVLLSANEDLSECIEKLTASRQMKTSTVLEEVAVGISHATVGRMIAEKWNFPEFIIEAIAYHHSPLNSEIRNRDVVNIIYMANAMCLIEAGKFDFLYLEDEILERYGLNKQQDFEALHADLVKQYSSQNTD